MHQRCAVVLWSTAPAGAAAPPLPLENNLPDGVTLPPAGQPPYPDAPTALKAGVDSGEDFVLLEAGVDLPPMALARLLKAVDQASDLTVVSAVHPDWIYSDWPAVATDSTLWWCLPRQVIREPRVNYSCSFWRGGQTLEATQSEADGGPDDALRGICSWLAVGRTGSAAAHPKPDPNSRPAASLLDRLAAQVWQLTDGADPVELPRAGMDNKPVLLHVLHSWGGGTARWVSDTASAWPECHHLFFMSSANPGSNQQGQEVLLRASSPDGPVVQRWTLSPPMVATGAGHPDYAQVLSAVIADHGVSALVVSSLIGHGVEALETDLPTLCMLHDYYPAWPDLGLKFHLPDADFSDEALPDVLAKSPFARASLEQWTSVRQRWLTALNRPGVVTLAPSDSVAQNLGRLVDPQQLPGITTVPHGLVPFETSRTVHSPATDKQRWRLVIPGRISELKGGEILKQALPALTRVADVYLLGGGKYAEDFYGCNHVHIVLQYQRQELPQLLDQIRPDLALLLSTAAETFNYTLSEMWALEVPVLASRVGALAERIEDGRTGLLIDPTSNALVEAVENLTAETLNSLAASSKPLWDPQRSAARYAELLALETPEALRAAFSAPSLNQLSDADSIRRLRETRLEARELRSRVKRQQKELERRAQWAAEQSRRAEDSVAWALQLEKDNQQVSTTLQDLQAEFDDRTRWALELNETVKQKDQQIITLTAFKDQLDTVVASRSWRITRPLRGAARLTRRILTAVGLYRQRAASLSSRTGKSLKTRGVKGTIDRIGTELRRGSPELHAAPVITADPSAEFEPLTFQHPEKPQVSVIIPTYNHYNHTQACLKSLSQHRTDLAFEVVVVDDCSSDETREQLARHEGLVVVLNEANVGFGETCNNGAAAASGEYLFFLNNDTNVSDYCLDRLLETFERHPDTGLAGAKLVYPDGRLQEAGGIVFSDGSGWNYGRFSDPAAPENNFVRETDYCSGAAVAITRKLFLELGGFDQRYSPAYYEDTDLAFQVREQGLKVRYQPAAQVVHFEGVTSGTDTTTGIKQYQVVNQTKFRERWAQALQTQPAPDAPLDVTRRHRCQRSVLIIDACTPTPDQDSGSVRMVNLMHLLLDLGWHVRFMAENRAFDDQYTTALQQMGVEVLYHPFVRSAHSYLKSVGEHLDAVILSRHYIATNHIESVRAACPRARLIFDTVDLHYLREQRLAELENDPSLASAAQKTRARELDVARRCDLTLVVSEYEEQFLAQDAPDLSVSVLSNIHPVHGCRQPFGNRKGLLFVGGFQHPPNVDGITWFVRQVLPLIRQELADVELTVIGSKITDEVRALAGDGVNVLGFVEDLEPYLDGCRLSIAPLRYGAGVKGKINMAMSYGQPVVATGPAVEGMHVVPGKEVMVGDTPEQFAAGVVEAYTNQDLWQTLSAGGLDNVQRHFSFAAASNALQAILKPE